jgi:hypothetical protein
MDGTISFTLAFNGSLSDSHAIDLYDVSQALVGFQRSLALTTHLVLNDEIITQAPALKGAQILALPSEPGSWKLTAIVLAGATGLYNASTAQSNSPLGHLVFSLYDYVISESLGFHIDYNKSLGKLYEDAQKAKTQLPVIRESQADSLIEKCSRAVEEMHRPIFKTHTAIEASITAQLSGKTTPLSTKLNLQTFEFIHETKTAEAPDAIEGRVSSYNSNTFKGRIYVEKYGRPVSFELDVPARSQRAIRLITTSLRHNALKQYHEPGSTVHCVAFENTSRSGHLKSLKITKVSDAPLGDA